MTNRPTAASCASCGREVQEAGAAAEKRREWDALPEQVRADYEKDYDRARERWDEHRRWLRRHRATHAVLGGIGLSLAMNAPLFFPSFGSLLAAFVLGAAAALALNLLRGGAYRGLGLFLAAALLSVLALALFINMEAYLKGTWLLSCFGLMFSAGIGYALGLKLDIEHLEHSMFG